VEGVCFWWPYGDDVMISKSFDFDGIAILADLAVLK